MYAGLVFICSRVGAGVGELLYTFCSSKSQPPLQQAGLAHE